MKGEAIMYLEMAMYINSLPPPARFWVYTIMITSIPILLLIDRKLENM